MGWFNKNVLVGRNYERLCREWRPCRHVCRTSRATYPRTVRHPYCNRVDCGRCRETRDSILQRICPIFDATSMPRPLIVRDSLTRRAPGPPTTGLACRSCIAVRTRFDGTGRTSTSARPRSKADRGHPKARLNKLLIKNPIPSKKKKYKFCF